MANADKTIDVKCSICNANMQMPVSFLEKIPDKKAENIPHICSDCTERMGEYSGDNKIGNFIEEINKQMEKLGKNNKIAEQIAEEITEENIWSLLQELKKTNASEKEKITESFYRGAWTTLFLIANSHGPKFLKKEAKKITDFHKKTRKI
ncbi:MAG TPA: hypothetical protein VJB94_00140 [Candidatus Nanoarchaeia archaeon]|nr:hypothetical protein [Candidatus Nanoarchaeia archaeon]